MNHLPTIDFQGLFFVSGRGDRKVTKLDPPILRLVTTKHNEPNRGGSSGTGEFGGVRGHSPSQERSRKSQNCQVIVEKLFAQHSMDAMDGLTKMFSQKLHV